MIQLHFILKCTKGQSSHFCDCFLVSKLIFQLHDRGLAKFHAVSEQPLVCDVIIIFIYPNVKSKAQLIMHSGNIECRLEVSKLPFKILLAESYLSVYVYQMNLNGKLRKKLGGSSRGPSKNLGAIAHPGPPLESPLNRTFYKALELAESQGYRHFLQPR